MRITRLSVPYWRNFREVQLEVPSESTLVCLVGENVSGKSNLLELISAAESELGISSGIEIPRGNPFDEVHQFAIELDLSDQIPELVDPARLIPQFGDMVGEWDGTIGFSSEKEPNGNRRSEYIAGGLGNAPIANEFTRSVISLIRERQEVQHLHLDADRAYPHIPLATHQYIEALGKDWGSADFNRQFSFRPTKTLYEQWIQYFLGREAKFATEHLASTRRANDADEQPPEFVDIFDVYKQSVTSVLPHLLFRGVDTDKKTLIFDSSGQPLPFYSLSGGEREIAFILGQIDRFRLRRGLLLLDEPELHLNPDLVRNWLSYLQGTIEVGQVWIATHSLEAVEVAGPSSTFVLERDRDTRLVSNIFPLHDKPVLSALSAAIGAPAFSLRRLRFIYIEGERQTRERERYFRICYGDDESRFIEAGTCKEVLNRVRTVRELAEESRDSIRVAGIVDGDTWYWTGEYMAEPEVGLFSLDCHEIENLFLEPHGLQHVLDRNGITGLRAEELTVSAADQNAGKWVWQGVVTGPQEPQRDLVRHCRELRSEMSKLDWNGVKRYGHVGWSSLPGMSNLDNDQQQWLIDSLRHCSDRYAKLRNSVDLWRWCSGKQALRMVAKAAGYRVDDVFERHVVELWSIGEVAVPTPLVALHEFIVGL
jgi:hypothetical protein